MSFPSFPSFPSRILAAGVFAAAVVGVLAVPARPVAADPPKAPQGDAEFAFVPQDAVGVVHIRVGELLRSGWAKPYWKVLEKAGPAVLDILNKEFHPAPLTAESLTFVFLPPAADHADPVAVSVFRFAKPYDRAKIVAAEFPGVKPRLAGKQEIYVSGPTGFAFPDDRTVVLGPVEQVSTLFTRTEKANPKFRDFVRQEAAGKLVFGAADLARIPFAEQAGATLPPEVRDLLKAKRVTVALDPAAATPRFDVRLGFANADAAESGEKAFKKAVEMARGFIPQAKKEFEAKLKPAPAGGRKLEEFPEIAGAAMALGALVEADEWLAGLPAKRDGSTLALAVEMPDSGIFQNAGLTSVAVGILLPAVQKVREAAARAKATNNLKQIALAMHAYHDANGHFPPAAITDKNGKPLLSWRVAILPYLEQDALYRAFKLDEPWDSENNKKLSQLIVKVYEDPRSPQPGFTHYKVFAGKGAMFGGAKGVRLTDVTDGTSNTIMVGAGGDPVIWTKPDDYPFDAEKPLPELMKPFPQWLVTMADGSVRVLRIPDGKDGEKKLKALITIAGGETVDLD